MDITQDVYNEYKTIINEASEKSLKTIAHKLLDVVLEDNILIENLRGQLRHGSSSLDPDKNVGPNTRRGALSTSYEAAEAAKSSASKSRDKVMTVLYEHGPLNDSEIFAIAGDEYVSSTLRPRRKDCVYLGWVCHHVVDDERIKRPTPNGRPSYVWELTLKGKEHVENNLLG